MAATDIRATIQDTYGAIARARGASSCCRPATGTDSCCDPISSGLYSTSETEDLPADAVSVSLGCGNPTALAALEPGQTVLDLGSGGGIDVLLSAKRVGPTGKVGDARAFLSGAGLDVDAIAAQVEGRFASAFIRARKPVTNACCGPACCGTPA